MKIMVCGEGSHDIGRDEWNPQDRSRRRVDGWLQSLLRNLGLNIEELVPRMRRSIVLLPRDERRHRPMPEGHGAKALAAKIIAEAEKCDLVIFMADADSPDPREWSRIRNQILDGFGRVDGQPAVACVPMSTSESWLLSDLDAWEEFGLRCGGLLPPRPERIWGAPNNPAGNHPHQVFARVCRNAGVADSRETRVQIATDSDIETITRKCPTSFQTFRGDVAALPSDTSEGL
jgi:hypothetical protein